MFSDLYIYLVAYYIYSIFFHSLHIVLLGLLLLTPLVALLSPLVLKLQTNLSVILLQFCGTFMQHFAIISDTSISTFF